MTPKYQRITHLFSILMALAIILTACATPQAPTQAPVATEAPVVTQAPAATEAPVATEAPTAAPEYPKPGVAGHLVLATTTSTQDSGLLDYLLPDFEKEAGVKVDVIAVGTGQAIKLGEDGNADVLLVHARSQEDVFMAAGNGTRREDVMYNDFIIVGPESDPAGIKGMTSAVDAFKKIAETKSAFLSRGDKSGTNTKELAIWKAAGITPEGEWYSSTGQGMGELLTMADETQGYTLSDRATYLARTKEGLKLIDWIISVPVQEKIGEFGKADFGQSLFVPDSAPWHAAQAPVATEQPAATEAPTAGAAALKITGKVKTEQAWSEEQIKAMTTTQAEATNKKGEKSTYTGVLIADLLKLAEPLPDAKTVVFVADDGYTAEAPLADVLACTNCIVSFRNNGGFSTVMPGFDGSLQVKGVIEIQIK
jgi:tungstate transport system substrate-binding protein